MSPLETLAAWISEAKAAGLPEPDAMALATVGADHAPSVRFVLCRGVDERGARFFTSYDSRKGLELAANPRAAAVFHWDWASLRRQFRIEGHVERLPADESDAYFAARPRGSQIAAAISPQSRPVESLEELQARFDALEARLAGAPVPRPGYWGGYLLRAEAVELWLGRENRMHDRVRHERHGTGWVATRLAP